MVLRIPLLNLNETKGVIILTEKRKDSALVTGEVLEFILMHVCGILEFWVLKCKGKIWTFVRFKITTVTYMCTDLCSGQIQIVTESHQWQEKLQVDVHWPNLVAI